MSLTSDDPEHVIVVPGRHFAPTASAGSARAVSGDEVEGDTWETATLLALRDRLHAGDIWVEGSRQWRAIEDQLISPALFTAMRNAGPLPVAVAATAEEYLAERRDLLDRRMGEINAKAVDLSQESCASGL
jgi:hypothetical protein